MSGQRKAAYAELKRIMGRRAQYMDGRGNPKSAVRYKWTCVRDVQEKVESAKEFARAAGLEFSSENHAGYSFIAVTIPDSFEHKLVRTVRERYGFASDTPRGIMADRCRDDGDEETAIKLMECP